MRRKEGEGEEKRGKDEEKEKKRKRKKFSPLLSVFAPMNHNSYLIILLIFNHYL